MSAVARTKKTSEEHMLRIVSRAFCCAVTIKDGRVSAYGTAPYLRRMNNMTEGAFLDLARARGWKVENTGRYGEKLP